MIKKIKKTSDIDEVNRLIREGWVVVDLNLNETLLALHDGKRYRDGKSN